MQPNIVAHATKHSRARTYVYQTFLYKLSYALYSVLDFCSILKGGRGVRKSLNRTEPAELCQAEPTLRRWLIDIDYITSYYSIHFMLFYKMNYQSLPKITPKKNWCLEN